MIFSVPFKVINLANKLQISISEGTTVGQRIVRESVAEHTKDGEGNYFHSEVEGKPHLINASNNYFLLQGKLKVRYEWEDSDKFKSEHLDSFLTSVRDKMNNVGSPARCESEESGDNFTEAVYAVIENSSGWTESAANVEPNCSRAEVVIMEDNTTLLCPMQHVTGWTFEKIDIPVGGSIVSEKIGEEMYIVFGQECFTYSTDGQWRRQVIEKHSTKKQVSQELKINNGSGDFCRLVRIYK